MNQNTRTLVSFVAIMCIAVGLLWFLRGNKGVGESPPPLTTHVEQIIHDWALAKEPTKDRVINLVLVDTSVGDDVLGFYTPTLDADESRGWMDAGSSGAKGRVFPAIEKEKIQQNDHGFFKHLMELDEHNLGWQIPDTPSIDREFIRQEIQKAMRAIHGAEAELNVVAQGKWAPEVLKVVVEMKDEIRLG
ncbi:hypothetical protein ACFL2T_07625, partial [Elusimicrobiota bacterium]